MSCKSVFCVQEAKSCLCMCAVNNCFKHLKFFFYVDDKHSDREPKRPRPGRIFVDAFHRYCRGGWHWHVAGQCQRSVRLSYLADKTAAVGFHGYVDLQHSAHGFGTLRRRHLFYLVQ